MNYEQCSVGFSGRLKSAWWRFWDCHCRDDQVFLEKHQPWKFHHCCSKGHFYGICKIELYRQVAANHPHSEELPPSMQLLPPEDSAVSFPALQLLTETYQGNSVFRMNWPWHQQRPENLAPRNKRPASCPFPFESILFLNLCPPSPTDHCCH